MLTSWGSFGSSFTSVVWFLVWMAILSLHIMYGWAYLFTNHQYIPNVLSRRVPLTFRTRFKRHNPCVARYLSAFVTNHHNQSNTNSFQVLFRNIQPRSWDLTCLNSFIILRRSMPQLRDYYYECCDRNASSHKKHHFTQCKFWIFFIQIDISLYNENNVCVR